MAAPETELERLVVRLVGDAAGYLKMLEEAKQATKEMGKETEGLLTKTEKMAVGITAAGAAITAVFGHFGKESFGDWTTAEKIGIKLSAVLKANGRDVEDTRQDYEEFALTMQKTTTAEDDNVLSLLKQAETFKLTGENAKVAVKQSLALAAINDSSAESMIRITAAMAKGDTETAMMFSRMIPQLRGIQDEAEFTSRYMALVASGTEVMGKEAETASGQLTQLKNEFGNFKEEIGKVLGEALKPAVSIFKETVDLFSSMPQPVKVLTAAITALGTGAGIAMAATGAAILAWSKLFPPLVAGFVAVKAGAASAVTWLTTYSIVTNAATIATKLLTFALMASPFIIVAGLAALVITKIYKTKEAYKELQALLQTKAQAKKDSTLEEVNKTLEGLPERTKKLEYLKTVMEDLDAVWMKHAGTAPSSKGHQGNEAIAEAADEARKRVQEMMNEIEKGPENKKLDAAIAESVAALEKQITTFGMSEDEIKRWELEIKGATDTQLEAYDSLVLYNNELKSTEEAHKKAADAGKDLEDSLYEEYMTMGLSTREIARWKAAQAGVTSFELIDYLTELNEEMEAFNKTMDDGERVAKELMNPMEKYTERVSELQELFDAGAISQDIFNRGLADAEEKLYGVEQAAKDTKSAVGDMNATLHGSAASLARIAAYRDALNAGGVGGSRASAGLLGTREVTATGRTVTEGSGGIKDGDKMVPILRNIETNTGKIAEQTNSVMFAPANLGG